MLHAKINICKYNILIKKICGEWRWKLIWDNNGIGAEVGDNPLTHSLTLEIKFLFVLNIIKQLNKIIIELQFNFEMRHIK